MGGIAQAENVDQRIAALEKQVSELKALLMSTREQTVSNTEVIKKTSSKVSEMKPKSGGTSFKYGGFVQLDSVSTNYSEGKPGNKLIEDFLVPSLIPVEPGSGESDSYSSTNIHTKTSRFFFTTSTPTAMGTVSSRFELDFVLSPGGDERISNSFNSRMRHAFLKWDYGQGKSVLAGQTWSTFFNVGALPGVQDFVGPVGTIFVRQPMIRWTSGPWQLALENPATRLNVSSGSRLDDAETLPDFIARYNGTSGDLKWSVAGMVRQLNYESRAGNAVEVDSDSEFGYGVSVAGKWMLGGSKDNFRYMFNYGSALGRYMGLNAFNDGYIGANGDIETIDQWGAVLSFEHYWSDQWRSHISLSAAGADNPDVGDLASSPGLAKSYQTLHANLQWLPAPKLMFGGELIYGSKELEDGREGDLTRLQFSAKYAF